MFCEDSLGERIKTELSKPRTAFIPAAKELFLKDWSIFQTLMAESNQEVRFAHNCAVEDGTLRTFQGFYLTGRLAGFNRELVLKRMRQLLSSGIHSQWKKWDSYRLAFNLSKPTTQQNAVPVSLTGSDVRMWFFLLCFCSFVASLVFGLEFLSKSVIVVVAAEASSRLLTWLVSKAGRGNNLENY